MRSLYQQAQNSRVSSEMMRSTYIGAPNENTTYLGQTVESGEGLQMPMPPVCSIMSVPDARDCICQVVLDWEFIHDLDLHLVKIEPADVFRRQVVGEPDSEPNPGPTSPSTLNLDHLVSVSGDFALPSAAKVTEFVNYTQKCVPATSSSGDPQQAVLQLDRNAAVHSHKPVENCYLTRTLEPGVYAVKVHNYSQRQLRSDLFPGTYRTWEDFTKRDPGYVQMEGALKSQANHADDEETPEKVELMQKADRDLQDGFETLIRHVNSGDGRHGVHYGVTVYTYPSVGDGEAKHPQAATVEELDNNLFPSEFFATSESILEASVPQGYNGGNTLADTGTEDGKLALCEKDEAYVALLKVVKENGRSRLAEVKMLRGTPVRQRQTVPQFQRRSHAVLHRGAGGASQPIVQVVRPVVPSARGYRNSSVPEPQPEPRCFSGQVRPTAAPSNTMQVPLGPQRPMFVSQTLPPQQIAPPQLHRLSPPVHFEQPLLQPQPLWQTSPLQAVPMRQVQAGYPATGTVLRPVVVVRSGAPVTVAATRPPLPQPQSEP